VTARLKPMPFPEPSPLGFRLSGAAIAHHRTCLSTELGSVLPRVKIASQRKMSFWNSGGRGRVLVAIIRRWREQRIANFRIHCLFTVIHCSWWPGKNSNFHNPWRCMWLRGIVRCSPPFCKTIRC